MTEGSAVSFASLLRQLRKAADLSQEDLARDATLSPRSVSDLERGINKTARRETARLLAGALGLTGPAREEFEAVATGRRQVVSAVAWPSDSVAVATRTLPRDVANFIGRNPELRLLANVVSQPSRPGRVVTICAIGGMAGVGKTAFAIHAAHQLAGQFPDGQIYLPLHGHTPGQQPVDPAEALASLLLTAGVAAAQIPPGVEARSRLWRDHLAGKRLLLLLDDATGHEQVRPLLPGTEGSLVLVTSRKNLTALEDAHAIRLDTLPPAEATALLIRLADRPGLKASDAAVDQIASLCGYLPLAIAMLARQLHYHPAWTCEQLATNLAEAMDRLHMMHAEDLSVAAAFELSYRDLTDDQQRLFRRLGLHPGSDFDAYAAAALDDTTVAAGQVKLDVLYDHHLLIEHAHGRYRFHDLLRESARTRANDDLAETRNEAVSRLVRYYAQAAQAASDHIQRRSPGITVAAKTIEPRSLPVMRTRDAAIRWMSAERSNLHAAASYASLHGMAEEAIAIPAAAHTYLVRYGYWDEAVALAQLAIGNAGEIADQSAEAGALTDLGDVQELIGDYGAAIDNFKQAQSLLLNFSNDVGMARALNELGAAQRASGDIAPAIESHEQALLLYRSARNQGGEASALSMLGEARRMVGDYAAAMQAQEQALGLFHRLDDKFGQAVALNRLGRVQRDVGRFTEAVTSHHESLRLNQELGDKIGQASALRALGDIHRAAGEHEAAAESYRRALRLYRELGHQLAITRTINDLSSLP